MPVRVSLPARRALLAAAAMFSVIGTAQAQGADDPARLVAIMDSYAAGLRANNVEALVALYASNGVFMRDNMPAVVGRDALRAAYREVFATLLKSAHVVVENFVPGRLEKYGLGPDWLHEVNDKLIIVRVSGWGQSGPYKHKPGFGSLVEAMSGFAAMNGFADRPPVLPPANKAA